VIDPGRTVTGAADGGPHRLVRAERLVVVFAPGKVEARARLLDPAGPPVVIGREPGDGGVTLPDREASRRHAEVCFEDGGWRVRDLGSRNGVQVDGVTTAEAPLVDGRVLRIGGSVLVFSSVEVAAGAPLRAEGDRLLGASVAMQLLRGELAQVAPRPLPVLLLGESGTGKELAARELHALSGRRGPLVTVNCAAIAPAVAESELFGHVAGAFTGATARREGLFAAADGGTLFLDEVGDLPLELQPKLLRALAVGEVRPVGGSETRTVDVRVVAATLVQLEQAVASGAFRGDLHARLAGWTVTMPPLRARRDDVLVLAAAWLAAHVPAARLSPGAAEALVLHGWPYNVRELEHVLAVAAARAGDEVIRAEHLPGGLGAGVLARSRGEAAAVPAEVPLALLVDAGAAQPTVEDLVRVLRHHRGSVALTAAFYGRDRRQIYRWLERLGLDPESYRTP
jgi:transcriptional regulator with GAF, ATPase, and Fis domain